MRPRRRIAVERAPVESGRRRRSDAGHHRADDRATRAPIRQCRSRAGLPGETADESRTGDWRRWTDVAQSPVAASWPDGSFARPGWTATQIDHELDVGRWQSPAPAVVVAAHGRRSTDGTGASGSASCTRGDGAVLSHLTAARRGRVCAGSRATSIDVLTPRGDAVLPLRGYWFHQTRRPYDRWVAPVSGPPRLPPRARRPPRGRARPQRTPRHRVAGRLRPAGADDAGPARDDDPADPQAPAREDLRARARRHRRRRPVVRGARRRPACARSTDARRAGRARSSALDKEGRRRYLDCAWILRRRATSSCWRWTARSTPRSVAWWKRHEARARRGRPGRHASCAARRSSCGSNPRTSMADLRRIGVPRSRAPRRRDQRIRQTRACGEPRRPQTNRPRRPPTPTSSSWPRSRGG